ncbi:MAG: gliding motility lipoprotein GldD [Flavobacteriaceae bacterium]|nr:gliding motility lipoprotein GldD [Flavobacteriaceae bacterium]
MKKLLCIFIIIIAFVSCKEDPLPKPKAYLRLDYPEPEYIEVNNLCNYSFEMNKIAQISNSRFKDSCWFDVKYSKMKGTIYLTYQPVNNDIDSLLRDTQNITQEHIRKADEIVEQVFQDDKNKVFGMFYEVGGNAASQSQFYLTDSVNHFLSGAVYFFSKPNYDSIYPASEYLKNDIRHLMESVRWKNLDSLN